MVIKIKVFLSSLSFSIAMVLSEEDWLTAVTHFPDLHDLYTRMLSKEPHTSPDQTTDVKVKKSICQHITSSGYFRLKKQEPVNMDDVHGAHYVIDRIRTIVTERKHPDHKQFRELLQDYEKAKRKRAFFRFGMVFTYPSKPLPTDDFAPDKSEYAFACVTIDNRYSNGNMKIYFVTDAYNINRALDTPTSGYVAARFVFRWGYSLNTLFALAEEPATAFWSPEHNIENQYLRMRKYYMSVENESEDPLCGLGKSMKIRVCASVLNSRYFKEQINHFPDEDNFDEKCARENIFFQSPSLEITAESKSEQSSPFKEWMLRCRAETIAEKPTEIIYAVSRAYNSHYVFVYFRHRLTDEWYLENISKNISVVIDECVKPPHCITL